MQLEARFPLNRLVALSFGGSLLLPVTLVGVLLSSEFVHTPPSTAAIALLFIGSLLLPMAVSLVATFAGRNAIRRGLMDGRWPSAEQAKQRNRLRSKPVTWLVVGLILSAVALPVFSLLHLPTHGHGRPWAGMVYLLLAPVLARTELLKLLAPLPDPEPKAWLHDLKPIESAHWGQH